MITTRAEIHIEKQVSETLFLLSVELERYKQWVPGMFMQITLKEKNASQPWLDGHSFSFASWGSDKALILVRREGPFTIGFVDKAKNGFTTSVRYPFGDFLLNVGKNKVLVAGGAGISVFLSYLDYINITHESSEKVFLVHSTKRMSESVNNIYNGTIPENVSIAQFITDNKEASYTGRPTFDDLKNFVPDLYAKDYFICGPPGFNSYWSGMLKSFGMLPKVEQWENKVVMP